MSKLDLRSLRISKGLLQREIADRVGVSIPFYSMVESGIRIPSLNCAKRIACVFGLTLDEFFVLVQENNNKL